MGNWTLKLKTEKCDICYWTVGVKSLPRRTYAETVLLQTDFRKGQQRIKSEILGVGGGGGRSHLRLHLVNNSYGPVWKAIRSSVRRQGEPGPGVYVSLTLSSKWNGHWTMATVMLLFWLMSTLRFECMTHCRQTWSGYTVRIFRCVHWICFLFLSIFLFLWM